MGGIFFGLAPEIQKFLSKGAAEQVRTLRRRQRDSARGWGRGLFRPSPQRFSPAHRAFTTEFRITAANPKRSRPYTLRQQARNLFRDWSCAPAA